MMVVPSSTHALVTVAEGTVKNAQPVGFHQTDVGLIGPGGLLLYWMPGS